MQFQQKPIHFTFQPLKKSYSYWVHTGATLLHIQDDSHTSQIVFSQTCSMTLFWDLNKAQGLSFYHLNQQRSDYYKLTVAIFDAILVFECYVIIILEKRVTEITFLYFQIHKLTSINGANVLLFQVFKCTFML